MFARRVVTVLKFFNSFFNLGCALLSRIIPVVERLVHELDRFNNGQAPA